MGPDLSPPFTAGDEATEWLFGLNRFGIRPGLIRVNGLLEGLGNPQEKLSTLVVAGTNGKGSTTRILARLLQASGYRVATYTSPHLLNVHERIMIDDRPVDPAVFVDRVQSIKSLVEKYEASWFETLTALAVQIAHDEKVDFLCCETGLGGRLDATNALPAVATLLTTVGLDHQRILGETIKEIAAEKLGLLKKGVPLFCGVDDSLRSQVFTAAVLAGSPCHFLDELARWDSREAGSDLGPWKLALREKIYPDLPDAGTLTMRRNVALAILALSELEKCLGQDLLPTDTAGALGNLFLPGRYQTVLTSPDWIFDTAHNAQALTTVLTEFLGRPGPGRKVVMFGAMQDKEAPVEMPVLLAGCDALVGVPVSLPRSRTSAELRDQFQSWGREPAPWPSAGAGWPAVTVAPDIRKAVRFLADHLEPSDSVLVTGSCFTVAETLFRLGFTDLEATRVRLPARQVLERIGED